MWSLGSGIENKKTSNPGTELIKVFGLLDKSSTPRSKGAVICMKPGLSAIDNYSKINLILSFQENDWIGKDERKRLYDRQ